MVNFVPITTEQRSLFFRTPLCFEGRILPRSAAQLLNYQSMTGPRAKGHLAAFSNMQPPYWKT